VECKPNESLAKTGVPGLDSVLVGGWARQHLYLVEGTPGSGKTTLALQFLLEGARSGERCLYFTLSETERELRATALSHGFQLDGITLMEITPLEADPERQQAIIHSSEVELDQTVGFMIEKVKELAPDRLVVDALTELRLLAHDSLSHRRQLLTLKRFFAEQRCTVMALDDLIDGGQGLQLHSIVHGVLSLEQRRMEYGVVRRRLCVAKLRGVDFRSGYHDFVIRTGGIAVFPSLVAAEHHVEFALDMLSSDVAALDDLLGGGLRRGTSTLLIGPSGVGKSSLALQYTMAAAGHGHRVAFFAFDENYRTAAERAAGLAMSLEEAKRTGALSWEQINPVALSPGEFVDRVKHHVEAGARLVVIDSLNSYMASMPEEQALLLHIHELLTYLGNQGVVTILIMAQHGLVGQVAAPIDLSFIADGIVLVRYFEAEGDVRKAISVLKGRGGRHETTIREYRLVSGEGISVGPPIRSFQGVLTGAPTFLGKVNILPGASDAGDSESQ
jgi:circadian clock protein KaiC